MVERLVLVGFMASGKSTVGPLVARRLGWGFVDMDGRIEARVGRSIARIFAELGESTFREEERRVAAEVAELKDHVVAAGGGAFAFAETRELLRAGALTIWLRCDLDTLLQRLPADGIRPLAGNRETIGPLLAERERSYALADGVVDASLPPESVAQRVVERMREGGKDR